MEPKNYGQNNDRNAAQLHWLLLVQTFESEHGGRITALDVAHAMAPRVHELSLVEVVSYHVVKPNETKPE